MDTSVRVGPASTFLLLLTAGCFLFAYLGTPSLPGFLVATAGLILTVNLSNAEPPRNQVRFWVLIAIPMVFIVLLCCAILVGYWPSRLASAPAERWVMPVQYRLGVALFVWCYYVAVAYHRIRRARAIHAGAPPIRT